LIDDGDVNSTVTASINTSSTADSKYDLLGSQTVTVTTVDDDTSSLGPFTLNSITPEIGRLELSWTALSGIDTSRISPKLKNDWDTTGDRYIMYWTTVPPASRTPTNRLVDDRDNQTASIRPDKVNFVHGGLDSTTTYYYRLAVVDQSNGDTQTFTTNELSGQPLPVDCTSTAGTGYIADNDPDLLLYYPFDNDLGDKSPSSSRGTGYPYDLVDSNDSIVFAEGCAQGTSVYFDGDLGDVGTQNDGTWGYNNDATSANLPLTDNWTLSLWINPDGDMEKDHSAFSSGNNNDTNCNTGSYFQIDLNKRFEIGVDGATAGTGTAGSCNVVTIRDNTSLELGLWVHLAFVHFGDNSAKLYVNGVTRSGLSVGAGQSLIDWGGIKVGLNRQGRANWKGYIDEIKLWDRSFSQSEVAAIYQKSLPPIPTVVNATANGSGQIDISWNEVPGASSYHIFRDTTADVSITDTRITGGTDTSGVLGGCSTPCTYSDTGLVSGTTYYYRVAGVNSIGTGNIAPSTEVSATAP